MLGEAQDGQEIGIVEGYATAASVHESIGILVVMAIDSGNLLPAALSLRARYPLSPLLIAGDNDVGLTRRTPPLRNVGLEKAAEAARQVAGRVSVPPSERVSKDWNDHLQEFGHEATAAAIRRSSCSPT